MRFARLLPLVTMAATTLLLAGCETAPRATHVAPVPPPSTPAAPPKGPVDWQDLPVSPGNWRYDPATTSARFGTTPDVTIRCDKATRTVAIVRAGATGPLTIQTSYGIRTLAPGAKLAASDPLLDQIVFSRGHVSIASPAVPLVVMPSWTEPGRVVEDCRG